MGYVCMAGRQEKRRPKETALKTKTWAKIVAGPTPAAPLPTDMQEMLKVREVCPENSTSTLSVEEQKNPRRMTSEPRAEKPRVKSQEFKSR